MNFFGVLMGVATLFIIGLGFPLVILGERRLGYLWWPYFLGLGVLTVLASLLVPSDAGSVVVGVLGATLIWGATELKDQAVRTELGWFPFQKQKKKPPFEAIIQKWKAPHL